MIDFEKLYSFLPDETRFKKLREKTVGFVGFGCAQLTGMMLARCGIRNFVLVDADVFKPEDITRNLFCFESTLGKYKVEVSKKFLKDINSEINVKVYKKLLNENNVYLLEDVDVIVEATGHPEVLKILLNFGKAKSKPIITFRPQVEKCIISVFKPTCSSSLKKEFLCIRLKTKIVHPLLLLITHSLVCLQVVGILTNGNVISFPEVIYINLNNKNPVDIKNFGEVKNELL